MKGFLGLLQIGLGIAGLVALFNGQWLAMIGAWVVAALIGFAGSRLVRRTEGVSEAGRQWGVGDMERGVELLLKGDYTSASRETASAVKTLVDEHVSGTMDHAYRLWNLLCLELWQRMILDDVPPISAPTSFA